MMRGLRAACICGLLAVLAASPAGAKPNVELGVDDVQVTLKRLLQKATEQFDAELFSDAAATLETAFALKPSGRILFNMARAFERGGQTQRAISAYQAYLQRRDAEPEGQERARVSLETLRRENQQPSVVAAAEVEVSSPPDVAQSPSPPDSDRPVQQELAKPAALVPTAQQVPASAVDSRPPRQASVMTPFGITAMGLGGAAFGVAAGFGVMASSAAGAARSPGSLDGRVGSRDRAYTFGTVSDVLWITGGCALVTGLAFVIIDQARPGPSR